MQHGSISDEDGHDPGANIGIAWSTLQARVLQMTTDARRGRPPKGVGLLGESLERITEALDLLEPKCQREVASFRPVSQFDPLGATHARTLASQRRGIQVATIASDRVRLNNP